MLFPLGGSTQTELSNQPNWSTSMEVIRVSSSKPSTLSTRASDATRPNSPMTSKYSIDHQYFH